jgi:hypothetical protein
MPVIASKTNDKKWCFMYFIRSSIRRNDGDFVGYPTVLTYDYVYPMTLPISETFLRHQILSISSSSRETEVLGILGKVDLEQSKTRKRVVRWLSEYKADRPVENMITKTRSNSEADLFDEMIHARIVVTVHHANWEGGDFRLWEALSSGKNVFA